MSLNNKRSRNNKNTKKIKGGKCGGVWPFQDSTCYLKHDSDVVVKQDANCKKVKDADGNEIWQVKIPVKGWNETDSATSTFTAETLEDADKEKILKNECDKLSSSEPTEETVEEPSEPIATETVAPTDTVESNIQPSAPAPFAPIIP